MFAVDQRDPTSGYSLVLFESEEKARARENDPRRAEGLESEVRELMAEVIDGDPEFVNLRVMYDGGAAEPTPQLVRDPL